MSCKVAIVVLHYESTKDTIECLDSLIQYIDELWSDSDEFIHAKCWETKMQNGGTHLVDHELLVPLETRINKCIAHNADAEYILKSKYKVLTRV